MADKHLTELEWKRFAKGKGFKDADLCKAMAALERAKSAAEEQAALEELGRQSQALRRAAKGDKAVTAYLDELDKAQAKQLQSATSLAKTDAKKAAAKPQDDDEGDDEDDDSPAVLTKGLVVLLRQVKQGAPMHAMIATDGKQSAVMLSKKTLAVAKSKVLKEYLGVSAIKPPILAQCIFEANAVTFVVAGSVSGLAKKIKGALLTQTEVRHKVRVRGEDPNEVDEDLEGDGALPAAETVEEVPVAPPEAPTDATAAKLAQAMGKLAPAIKRVVAERPDVKADLLQSVARFQAEIKEGDLAAARETLFETAALVKRLEAQQGEGSSSGKVKFEQVHLDWDSRKKTVESRLAELNRAILADGDIPEGPTAASKLGKLLARFNEGLGDTLDELRNAGEAAERRRLGSKAQGIAERYLAYLADDPLVAHVEDNPYDIAVDVRATLSPPLADLKSQVQALLA